jgi:hypothetical protein
MVRLGLFYLSSVAQIKPAATRAAANGSEAVQVAPTKQKAAAVRIMTVRGENDYQSR